MNELLIQSLSDQADVDTRNMSTGYTKASPWKKRFAELIVLECLSIARDEHKNALEFNWDNDDTAQTIIDSIGNHFGAA